MADQPINSELLSPVELLHWYIHAGVDIALEEKPVDQFAVFEQQSKSAGPGAGAQKIAPRPARLPPRDRRDGPRPAAAKSTNQMSDAAMPDEAVISDARQLAKDASSLEELRQIMAGFKGCNLRLSAKKMVFGDGNPTSDIMLIGEAPGRDEDLHGLPFVGRSGQLLDRMLAAIELDREKVYITNVIPWRPPGNRTPTPLETEICRPFIERHIELVSPKVLVLLGGASAKALLNSTQGILKMRGRWNKVALSGGKIDA